MNRNVLLIYALRSPDNCSLSLQEMFPDSSHLHRRQHVTKSGIHSTFTLNDPRR